MEIIKLKKIIKHTVLICSDKKERCLMISAILEKLSVKSIISLSINEALRMCAQEMPHLIICDLFLSDGNAILLYDKLKMHPILKNIPIWVIINKDSLSSSDQELIKRKNFAGLMYGKINAPVLAQKISDILFHDIEFISPFMIDVAQYNIQDQELILTQPANIIGRTDQYIVIKSNVELDYNSTLECIPTSPGFEPMILKNPINIKYQSNIYNIYNIFNSVHTTHKEWIHTKLPIFSINPSAYLNSYLLIVNFQKNPFYAELKNFLTKYGIKVNICENSSDFVNILKEDLTNINCICIDELDLHSQFGQDLESLYLQIPQDQRPVLLVLTSKNENISTAFVRYLTKPFGLGQFLTLYYSTFIKPKNIYEYELKNKNFMGINITYSTKAKLISLDEIGGLFTLKFPLASNIELKVRNIILEKILPESKLIKIAGSVYIGSEWVVRFINMQTALSKLKYFQSVLDILDSYKNQHLLFKDQKLCS